jgi:hypothetical protein
MERIMSKKSKTRETRTGGKGKLPGKVNDELATCDRLLENPERKWRLALSPNETIVLAEDALLLQLVIQNVGPAVFEVTVGNGDSVVLTTGKMTVLHAYGKIRSRTSITIQASLKSNSCRGAKNLNEADIRPQKG